MKSTTTIGLDLAKEVFQIHGVDADQKVAVKRQLKRKDLLAFFAKLPPCLVGIEACGTAHYWAREIRKLGHTVRLLPPSEVKPYCRRGKSDAIDAEAICEAVQRPRIKQVPIKSVTQQGMLMCHRVRELLVAQRTATINAMRAHLAEIGIIAPEGHEGVKQLIAILRDGADARVPDGVRRALLPLVETLAAVGAEVAAAERAINRSLKEDETAGRLTTIPGIGPITATALSASVADARVFKSARAFAAWLGLTPRLDGTGGRVTLGSITKKGDGYLRKQLYLGAVSVLSRVKRKLTSDAWAEGLLERLSFKEAAVAVANKMARTAWALMARGGTYEAGHEPVPPKRARCPLPA